MIILQCDVFVTYIFQVFSNKVGGKTVKNIMPAFWKGFRKQFFYTDVSASFSCGREEKNGLQCAQRDPGWRSSGWDGWKVWLKNLSVWEGQEVNEVKIPKAILLWISNNLFHIFCLVYLLFVSKQKTYRNYTESFVVNFEIKIDSPTSYIRFCKTIKYYI